MSEGPKLYTNKPRKEQIKRNQKPSAMGTQTTAAPPPPPPPPPPKTTKEPFIRRYKFLWPMILAVNLAVGAYVFMRTNKKDDGVKEQEASPVLTKDTIAAETSVSSPPIATPVIRREPIPEDQQRELFKWILEEKRKIKPKDAEEKRRIDEEKALLKQFIRSKSIPNI